MSLRVPDKRLLGDVELSKQRLKVCWGHRLRCRGGGGRRGGVCEDIVGNVLQSYLLPRSDRI